MYFLIKKNSHTHCVYSTEFVHFITPYVNPSISVHCKNSWLFRVIQHRRRYCSVPLLLYNNLKKKYRKCSWLLPLYSRLKCPMKVLEYEVNFIWLVEYP